MKRDILLLFGVISVCFSCHENRLWSWRNASCCCCWGGVTWITKHKYIVVIDMIKIELAITKPPPPPPPTISIMF